MSVKIRFGVHFSFVMIHVPFKITSNTEEEEEFMVPVPGVLSLSSRSDLCQSRNKILQRVAASAVRPDFRGKGEGGGQAS